MLQYQHLHTADTKGQFKAETQMIPHNTYHSINFSLSHLKWLSSILVVVAGICKKKKNTIHLWNLFNQIV